MRLRHRLLGLFGLFAVTPLLAIAAFSYARSLRSLEALVENEASEQAERIARALRDRLDHMESDIALLSGNEETQQLLAASAAGDAASAATRLPSAERYLDELWSTMRYGYERIAIADQTGGIVLARQDPLWQDGLTRRGGLAPIVRTITASDGSRPVGHLDLYPRAGQIFPTREMQEGFGERRLNMLLDRGAGSRMLASGGRQGDPPVPAVLLRAASLGGRGTVRYDDAGERRIATFVSFQTPPWTVVATASVSEFAPPFVRQRLLDLGLLLLVITAVSLGFFLLLRRATRPLDQLAAAATRVGQGDLAPDLPPITPDEVGHLTSAFGAMAVRLREMLAQVEASRQTAVLGRFAVELAHEIRNPLTAVKLNLQALDRDGRDGRIPQESRSAVDTSLREIRRIDQALRTALRIGRPAAPGRPYDVRTVLHEAVALLRPEADAHHVHIEPCWNGASSSACGDPEAVRGVFVNLLLNAIQAMASTRVAASSNMVRVEAHDALLRDETPAVEIRFRDDGPGIPPEFRDRVFHPFFTTKDQGTGLGLSVALQTVQAMGGTLRCSDAVGSGAEFIVTLPLTATEASVD
jgi:signal transduction histidine kinase